MSKFNCVQHNIGRNQNTLTELFKNLQATDILCIQEPYLYKGRLPGVPSSWRTLHAGEGAGTAIIIPNRDIICFPVLTSTDLCVARLTVANDSWLLLNFYWSCRARSIRNYLRKIKEVMVKYPSKYILLLGDTNARSPLWGGEAFDRGDYSARSIKDKKGHELEEFLIENNLYVCNERTSPPPPSSVGI